MIEYYDLDPLIQILNLTFARKILFARKRVKVSRLVIRVKKKRLKFWKEERGNEEELNSMEGETKRKSVR